MMISSKRKTRPERGKRMKLVVWVHRRLLACVAVQYDTLHIVWLPPNRIRGEVWAAEQNIPERNLKHRIRTHRNKDTRNISFKEREERKNGFIQRHSLPFPFKNFGLNNSFVSWLQRNKGFPSEPFKVGITRSLISQPAAMCVTLAHTQTHTHAHTHPLVLLQQGTTISFKFIVP